MRRPGFRRGLLLSGLFVRLVCSAPAAVLLEFDALTRVGLVLDRHVVAPLALLARQVDRRPLVRCHVALSRLSIQKIHVTESPGGELACRRCRHVPAPRPAHAIC